MRSIEIGRLLSASISGFVVGCSLEKLAAPVFGALVRAPVPRTLQIYGVVYDVRLGDDPIIRSVAKNPAVSDAMVRDQRINRVVPVEIKVLAVGYRQASGSRKAAIFHQIPPQPPLSLETIYLCSPKEVIEFTSLPRLDYLELILNHTEAPQLQLLMAHIAIVQAAHAQAGDPAWHRMAVRALARPLQNRPEDYIRIQTHFASHQS